MRLFPLTVIGLALALLNCNGNASGHADDRVVAAKSVGAEGGEVSTVEGDVTLHIPSDAVGSALNFTIAPANLPGAIGSPVEIGPTGTVFSKPVLLTFKYKTSDLAGRSEADLRVGTFEGGAWSVLDAAIIDTKTHTVSAPIQHLSPWGVQLTPPRGPSKSGCTPRSCQEQMLTCGTTGDGCGGVLACGDCQAGLTCGGGGQPGVCGSGAPCKPLTCGDVGLACGAAADGCGGQLSCGSCAAGMTCGGGGQPGICSAPPCTPRTCEAGVSCGALDDGCGHALDCGACSAGKTCIANACAETCTPKTCASSGVFCGELNDGCGHVLQCGACAAGQTCSANVCKPACTPRTCASTGAFCGQVSDGCGGLLECGICAAGLTCVSGVCKTG